MNSFSANVQWLEAGVWQPKPGWRREVQSLEEVCVCVCVYCRVCVCACACVCAFGKENPCESGHKRMPGTLCTVPLSFSSSLSPPPLLLSPSFSPLCVLASQLEDSLIFK